MKYPIRKDLFPFSRFTPPLISPRLAGWIGAQMRPPKGLRRDPRLTVTSHRFESYDGQPVQALLLSPKNIGEHAPCLVLFHGGAFLYGGAGHHYRSATAYALRTPCRVLFVQYRLAPQYPHPTPSEDCYAAFRYVLEHAQRLGVDPRRVAVGGDSAGGALAAAVCQMARDRGSEAPCLQLLIYPVTDRRMQTASHRTYTDTPVWNSRLSAKMWQSYLPDPHAGNIAYASPMEARSFKRLPVAYVETAEFDCLHDEAVNYASALRRAGVPVTLCETKGTMHGFDAVERSGATKAAMVARIRYLRRVLYGKRRRKSTAKQGGDKT